ncbi:MAG: SMP-30/gluconolactonase/LRE family protein [Mycobacteriales bacterium]
MQRRPVRARLAPKGAQRMTSRTVERPDALLSGGFSFPEGLRFHQGRIWFSDMHTGEIFSVDPDTGTSRLEHTIDDRPSGLGWLSDGSLLVSGMLRRQVLRLYPDGQQTVHADLSGLEEHPTNELLVDDNGQAFLGSFGYDIYADEPLTPAKVYRIAPDGTVTLAADGFDFPNGTVILPGTRTLVIAHSFRPELTAFEIDDDGTLTDRRIWATLPEGTTTDGTAVDSLGRVWVSALQTSEYLRVSEGGEITCRLAVPGRLAVDVVVDGRDDDVVYLATSNHIQPSETKVKLGAIERVQL